MQLLALDTSTETMSIAVARVLGGRRRLWQRSAAGGAQASATLIPSIVDLMAEAGLAFGELDAIAFGRGPGAFTGLRTACSVAQGLAFGAQAAAPRPALKVLPVDTLLALAEEARCQQGCADAPVRVLAMLDARMDELYAGAYVFDGVCWTQLHDYRLQRPENLVLPAGWLDQGFVMAGNVFACYGERLPAAPAAPRLSALPTAAAMLRLADALLADGQGVQPEDALPIYIRDKVALTTSERLAARAGQSSLPPPAHA